MKLNQCNICEDWGWYVDIENNNHILPTNLDFISHKPYKKINYHYNRLETIEEDEYDYYKKNYKDNEEIELDNCFKKQSSEDKKSKDGEIFLYKIGSTTLITALLTYAIFFLI